MKLAQWRLASAYVHYLNLFGSASVLTGIRVVASQSTCFGSRVPRQRTCGYQNKVFHHIAAAVK